MRGSAICAWVVPCVSSITPTPLVATDRPKAADFHPFLADHDGGVNPFTGTGGLVGKAEAGKVGTHDSASAPGVEAAFCGTGVSAGLEREADAEL